MGNNFQNLEKIFDNYYNLKGFLFQNIFVCALAIYLYKYFDIRLLFENYITIQFISFTIFIILSLIIVNMYWYSINFKFPDSNKSKHNILICFDAENYNDYKYMRKIFIRRLKRKVESIEGMNMSIVSLQYMLSKKLIKMPLDKRHKVLKMKNYNIVLTGYLDRGNSNKIPRVEIETDIGVTTSLLKKEVKIALSEELSTLIGKYVIREEEDLFDSDLISNELIIIFEYISVIASLLSGNAKFALYALKHLKPLLESYKNNNKSINFIKSKFKSLENDVYVELSSTLYSNYLHDLNESVKIELENLLEDMHQYPNLAYQYHMLKGAIIMMDSHNSKLARNHIDKAKKIEPNDISWKYSITFLECFEGNFLTAYRNYKDILKKPHFQIIGIEDYISKIYELYPEHIQFDFALGMINEIAKKDYILAKEHYSKFIEKSKNKLEYSSIAEVIESHLLKL